MSYNLCSKCVGLLIVTLVLARIISAIYTRSTLPETDVLYFLRFTVFSRRTQLFETKTNHPSVSLLMPSSFVWVAGSKLYHNRWVEIEGSTIAKKRARKVAHFRHCFSLSCFNTTIISISSVRSDRTHLAGLQASAVPFITTHPHQIMKNFLSNLVAHCMRTRPAAWRCPFFFCASAAN